METSENIDRERRRVRSRKKRRNWARFLIRPQTFKTLVAVGKWVTQVIYIALAIIRFLRE